MHSLNVLRGGFHFRIWSENSSAWYDSWSSFGRGCEVVPYVHISESDYKIKDLWHKGLWDFSRLTTAVPKEVENEISMLSFSSKRKLMYTWILGGYLSWILF